jgi:3-oxoadipate enol-lactonase
VLAAICSTSSAIIDQETVRKGIRTMPTVSIDGTTLAYDDLGQGKPIVFLHGIYVSKSQWRLQLEYFAQNNYHVIACDLRGHGGSSAMTEPCSMVDMAGDVIAVLDQLGLEQVVCCGHSFGGMVAQELVLSYPERVAGLILAETIYGAISTPWEAATTLFTNIWLPQVISPKNYTRIMASFFGMYTPEAAPYILDEARRYIEDNGQSQQNILRASLTFDSRWRLEQISCPTLILVGQYPHLPLIWLHAWEMWWRIKRAKLTVIPAAGHLLHWDNPKAFNEAIAQFAADL